MSIQDEKIKRCISVARLFNKNLEIHLNHRAEFIISIPYAWKKESPNSNTIKAFFGLGFTLDEAARDFLRACAGWIIVEDGVNPRVERAVVCP